MFDKEKGIIKLQKKSESIKTEFLTELDEEQAKPVSQIKGAVLVIAGAGSGKTRVLTYRVANMIHQGVKPEEILLLTFMNKSAQEMMKRIEKLLGRVPYGLTGGTYHSIGNMAVRRYAKLLGLENNYTLLDGEDSKDVFKLAIAELEIDTTETRLPKPSVLKEILSLSINKRMHIHNIIREEYPHFFSIKYEINEIIEKYHELKRKNNMLDFDDILVFWHKLLSEHETIRNKYANQIYRYILVDEFQDTNFLQFDIVKLLAGDEQNIMVVGDPNQSIYRWRGAEIDNILDFPSIFPNTKVLPISYNYRSTPQILDFANYSIKHNTKKSDVLLKSKNPDGEKPYVIKCDSSENESAFISQRILQLHDEGVDFKRIGILYRSHYLVKDVEIELTTSNIPYDIRSGLRFFEQKHIKDMVALIKVLNNPRDEISWMRLIEKLEGIGTKTAKTIIQQIVTNENPFNYLQTEKEFKFLKRGKNAWLSFVEVINQFSSMSNVEEILRLFLQNFYDSYAQLKFDNYKDRIADIHSLIEFATKYNDTTKFLEEITLLDQTYGETNKGSDDQEKDKITLTTIHKAKGLEWDYVFVIGCGETQFPSSNSMKEIEELEEERRLFYVASTRAKKELYITYSSRIFSFESGSYRYIEPSMFIQELDKTDLYQFYNVE